MRNFPKRLGVCSPGRLYSESAAVKLPRWAFSCHSDLSASCAAGFFGQDDNTVPNVAGIVISEARRPLPRNRPLLGVYTYYNGFLAPAAGSVYEHYECLISVHFTHLHFSAEIY